MTANDARTALLPPDRPIKPARPGTTRWHILQLRVSPDDFLRHGRTVSEIAHKIGRVHGTTRNACELLAFSGELVAYYATGQLGRAAIHYRRPAADDT